MGVGVGSLIGILFAARSGKGTREFLAKKASEGNEYARNKAREMMGRAEEVVDHGKRVIAQTKEQIATAIDAGRKTYQREKSKAHVG